MDTMSAVHLTIEGEVAELKLDNPAKLNAFTTDMLAQLDGHLDALRSDQAIKAVILNAAGDRAFCVGADINAWADLPPRAFARNWVHDGHRIFDKLARLPQPTIAAIGGYAFGGGLELAAACDIRILGPKAQLALPEAGVGVVPGWSGTQRLLRCLPEAMVREMALFGQRISADRALQAGFAACVVKDLRIGARYYAEQATKQAPFATEMIKSMINAAVGEDRPAAVEALASAAVAASHDLAEGVQAFREKRPSQV